MTVTMKSSWRYFSCLVLLLLVTGCASLIVGGGTGHNTAGNDARTASERSSDSRIISTINSRYVHEKQITALDIKVSCYRGVVTLRGQGHSRGEADRAIVIARSTANVKKVVSKLSVGHY